MLLASSSRRTRPTFRDQLDGYAWDAFNTAYADFSETKGAVEILFAEILFRKLEAEGRKKPRTFS